MVEPSLLVHLGRPVRHGPVVPVEPLAIDGRRAVPQVEGGVHEGAGLGRHMRLAGTCVSPSCQHGATRVLEHTFIVSQERWKLNLQTHTNRNENVHGLTYTFLSHFGKRTTCTRSRGVRPIVPLVRRLVWLISRGGRRSYARPTCSLRAPLTFHARSNLSGP